MSDSRAVAEWSWIIFARENVLHAPVRWSDPDFDGSDGGALTACGRTGTGYLPGILTRLSGERCVICCAVTSMPSGTGSPKNDDTCRPVVEARVAALTDRHPTNAPVAVAPHGRPTAAGDPWTEPDR